MSEAMDDMVAYTNLTDNIFQSILYSTDPNLTESRRILNDMMCRKLYKCIGQTSPGAGKLTIVSGFVLTHSMPLLPLDLHIFNFHHFISQKLPRTSRSLSRTQAKLTTKNPI
jgi:hypothetical protein